MSGLGAEFENEPLEGLVEPLKGLVDALERQIEALGATMETLEGLVLGGQGKPLVATPPLPKEGVVETERATAEDCLKAGGDDFLV